jgi:hypothetical protein
LLLQATLLLAGKRLSDGQRAFLRRSVSLESMRQTFLIIIDKERLEEPVPQGGELNPDPTEFARLMGNQSLTLTEKRTCILAWCKDALRVEPAVTKSQLASEDPEREIRFRLEVE